MDLAFCLIIFECLFDNSIKTHDEAPLLMHSKPNAPVPANNSRTREFSIVAPRLLNMANLTLSGVGRTPNPLGTFNVAPPEVPPMIRISIKENCYCLSGFLQHSIMFYGNNCYFCVCHAWSRGVACPSFFWDYDRFSKNQKQAEVVIWYNSHTCNYWFCYYVYPRCN